VNALASSPLLLAFVLLVASLALGCGARTGLPTCGVDGVTCPTVNVLPDGGTPDAEADAGQPPPANHTATMAKCSCSCSNLVHVTAATIPACLPPNLNYQLATGAQQAALQQLTDAEFVQAEDAYCNSTVATNLTGIVDDLPATGYLGCATCTCSVMAEPEMDVDSCGVPCTEVECSSAASLQGCFFGATIDIDACNCNTSDPNTCGVPATTLCRAPPGTADPQAGILTGLFAEQSTISVNSAESSVTATVSGDTETSTLSGNVSVYGEVQADGTANLVLDLGLTGTTVTFSSVPVTNITLVGGTGVATFLVAANGMGMIPQGVLSLRVGANINGMQIYDDQTNMMPLMVTVDFANDSFTIMPFSLSIGGTSATVSLSGTITNQPPRAVVGPNQTVECTSPSGAMVTLDGSGSFDPEGTIVETAWRAGSGFIGNAAFADSLTTTVEAPFSPPATTSVYTLLVANNDLQLSLAETTITVVDTIPPTFAPLPASIAQTLCNPATQATVIPIPTATDTCTAVTVTGAIVSANGTTLITPIPVGSGSVSLAPGVYVIQWTATDQSGNVTTTTQTLTVSSGIEANGAVSIDNNAVVQLPNGTPSAIANTGTGQVSIGVTATTGNILTEGSVFLASRANVQGSIQAAGTLSEQPPVTVTGAITTGAHVPLPLGPTLSGIVLPSPLGAAFDLEPGVVGSLAPGAYTSIAVKSRAVLTLSSGTYFVGSLDLEPQAILNLKQAAGPVQLYVQSSIIDRGQIQSISGTAGSFVLGYAGTSTFYVQSPFLAGTLIAPNADVVISSLGANAFTGELFAQSFEIQPDATLTCEVNP
jgi:hypothetical protein